MSIGDWISDVCSANLTQIFLIVNPDGKFVGRVDKTVGGGAGWGVSDGASEGTSGYWKTEGNIIHAGNGKDWQPYARYNIERGTLMLTFADNSRELWNRSWSPGASTSTCELSGSFRHPPAGDTRVHSPVLNRYRRRTQGVAA